MDSSVVIVEIVAIGSTELTVVIVAIELMVPTGEIGLIGVIGAIESIGLIGVIGLIGGIGEIPIEILRLIERFWWLKRTQTSMTPAPGSVNGGDGE